MNKFFNGNEMTGIIINNNEYQVNTGNTKIEYNSMGGESVGYSMYGDDIPYTEILKEYPLEYLRLNKLLQFSYLHIHDKTNKYKAVLEIVTPYTSGYCNYIFETKYQDVGYQAYTTFTYTKKSNGNYATYGYHSVSYKKKQGSSTQNILNYKLKTLSEDILVIPLNTKFMLGYDSDKYWSDIDTGIYHQEYCPQPSYSGGGSTPNIGTEVKTSYGPAVRFYSIEEIYNNVSYYYKPFYNTEIQKFYIKETTTNTIVCTLDPSDIDEYQILN